LTDIATSVRVDHAYLSFGEATLKRLILVLTTVIAVSPPAFAGDTENIQACIKAIEVNTGKQVDEFDVQYESHLLAFDVARWPDIECEVMVEEVQNLSVDGKRFIVDGWPSPEAKAAYEALEQEVTGASAQLATRQKLIEGRLSEAYDKLRQPNADIDSATDFVRQGINKALGN
jgi:hypothetical protein